MTSRTIVLTRLTLIFLVFFKIVDNVVEFGGVEGSTRR